ncbi:hypothetical protein IAD21_03480 [Abditibacteriota bacterium]|nr:hypothetical protein IAD21_03480 [Abditibacteriota bacterium]
MDKGPRKTDEHIARSVYIHGHGFYLGRPSQSNRPCSPLCRNAKPQRCDPSVRLAFVYSVRLHGQPRAKFGLTVIFKRLILDEPEYAYKLLTRLISHENYFANFYLILIEKFDFINRKTCIVLCVVVMLSPFLARIPHDVDLMVCVSSVPYSNSSL